MTPTTVVDATDATEMNHGFHRWHRWAERNDDVCAAREGTRAREDCAALLIRAIRAICGSSTSVASTFLALLVVLAPQLVAAEAVSANDQARFLAGLPISPRSPLAAAAGSAAWKAHAAEMDAAWIKSESRSISKTRDWAASFVRGGGAPCYYMFSGPDILYAHTIFPGAPVYVLCGNEPIGSVPDVIGDAALASVRQSLSNVMRFSYFITKDMRADLSGSQQIGRASCRERV